MVKVTILTCICLVGFSAINLDASANRTNIIIFLADDLGYGDLASYGHVSQEHGAIDDLAKEGLKFTHAYSASTFCTPSRAALLTGRQPFRTGMYGPLLVQLPQHTQGLPHEEITIAEALKPLGYQSGIVGKWHLGINNCSSTDGAFLPHSQGFDFVGTILPFTLVTRCDTEQVFTDKPHRSACFLYRNRSVVQQPIDLTQLTPTLVNDAKVFLHENNHGPFFLYFSFPQTHTPMYNMPVFRGSSKRGVFGDQINEMSWAVNEIMDTIKNLGIAENTLTLFMSDHGPHLEMCNWGGHTGPFRGGKGNYFEGGIRIPFIVHWPSVVQQGTTSEQLVSIMDVFPTILEISGNSQPKFERIIDGRSLADVILGTESNTRNDSDRNIREVLFIYELDEGELIAARFRNYKIYFQTQEKSSERDYVRGCTNGIPRSDYYYSLHHKSLPLEQPEIYDIVRDPKETKPIRGTASQFILDDFQKYLEAEMNTWTDRREAVLSRKHLSHKVVPCCNPPFCFCNSDQSLSHLSVCSRS